MELGIRVGKELGIEVALKLGSDDGMSVMGAPAGQVFSPEVEESQLEFWVVLLPSLQTVPSGDATVQSALAQQLIPLPKIVPEEIPSQLFSPLQLPEMY
mmetsp:Transcript_19317/g.28335  ORF Transcript_19317/g.28335 Transcript_19317/m.28335 type:complete len:99 (-) Transcript_19317:39-335(-)